MVQGIYQVIHRAGGTSVVMVLVLRQGAVIPHPRPWAVNGQLPAAIVASPR